MSTKIEWVTNSEGVKGETWNPFVGCSRVSPGCQACYAERMAKRLIAMGQEKYQGTVDKNGRWTGNLNFDIDNYQAPLKRKTPTVYFVNSMSDLFHEKVGFNWIMRVWDVMRDTPQHTYQILTKRADIMSRTGKALSEIYGVLPNVWLGVSVETQQYADERIPYLLETPAAIRFLSCEPLLGPVDLDGYLGTELQLSDYDFDIGDGVDWVIVGGESGPGARAFDLDWANSLVKQCQNTDTAVFVKQLGSNPRMDNVGYPTKDKKGGDINEWPEWLRVREFPK